MSETHSEEDQPVCALKNEFARQRWELFHRAIAHAKQSNVAALQDSDAPATSTKAGNPVLTLAR